MAFCSHSRVAHFLRSPESCSRHQRNQIRCQKARKGMRRAHHAGGAELSALPWFANKLSPTSSAHLADFPFLCCLINAEWKTSLKNTQPSSTASCSQLYWRLDGSSPVQNQSRPAEEINMRSFERPSSGKQKGTLVCCKWIKDAKRGAGPGISLHMFLGQRKLWTSSLVEKGH